MGGKPPQNRTETMAANPPRTAPAISVPKKGNGDGATVLTWGKAKLRIGAGMASVALVVVVALGGGLYYFGWRLTPAKATATPTVTPTPTPAAAPKLDELRTWRAGHEAEASAVRRRVGEHSTAIVELRRGQAVMGAQIESVKDSQQRLEADSRARYLRTTGQIDRVLDRLPRRTP